MIHLRSAFRRLSECVPSSWGLLLAPMLLTHLLAMGRSPHKAGYFFLRLLELLLAGLFLLHQSRDDRALRRELAASEARFNDLLEQSAAGMEKEKLAQARLAAIAASSDDAILGCSAAGSIEDWNYGAQRMFGYLPDEILGHSISELLVPHGEGELARIEGVIRELRSLEHYQTGYRQRDGRIGLASLTISPIRDALGRSLGSSIIARDVTEHHEMQESLRRSENRFRTLYEHAPLGIEQLDVHGRILEVNNELCRLLGYPREELEGCNFRQLTLPEDLQAEEPLLADLLADRRSSYQLEKRYLHHDGHPIWVRIHSRLTWTGCFPCRISIIEDISQEKRMQAEREELLLREKKARTQAEAASMAKDHFMAVLSHELRSPLTPALAIASQLEFDEALPTAARRDLAMIRRNIETEAALIDDLLDVTRITRGKVELHREVADLHNLIQWAMQSCQSTLDAKQIRLTLHLDAADHMAWVDPARMQQVLLNLLHNAIKFTPPAGSIQVTTRSSSEEFLFQVSDSGTGIDPELLGRIFEPFEQGEKTVARRFGGLGLGLAICRSLVELHQGQIEAESPGRNQGATFRVHLPRVSVPVVAPKAAPASPARAEKNREGLRILLVEDHPDTLKIMTRLLQSCGYQVQPAGGYHEALERAASEDFDILVSDIGMPDGTGLELIRALQERLSAPIKGIALSGFGMEEDRQRSREAGFAEHLTKPINFQYLQETLRKYH